MSPKPCPVPWCRITAPLVFAGSASPIVMVELTAQTAGVNNSINRLQTRGKEDGTMGWIAGVKSALFHMDSLPVGGQP
ncbi:hypothetical protein [Desulfobacter sp.]|uniref:hypothetical protein n=1 Tax=Desulfobacter sp. TaxID=2294 RepID=UPI003D13CAE5